MDAISAAKATAAIVFRHPCMILPSVMMRRTDARLIVTSQGVYAMTGERSMFLRRGQTLIAATWRRQWCVAAAGGCDDEAHWLRERRCLVV